MTSQKRGGTSSCRTPLSVVSAISNAVDTCSEHKGKTLYLLKKASKPVPTVRKRIKRNTYNEDEEEQKMIQLPRQP